MIRKKSNRDKRRVFAEGWRSDSMHKSTVCFFRGPKFDSQHLRGSSKLSVTSVPRDVKLSSGHLSLCMHVHRQTCRQNTHKHTKINLYIQSLSNISIKISVFKKGFDVIISCWHRK